MDEVLRYFVVHDYACNGDSYTGSMVHNYYLHESDGKLSMIPWDYNLAFGGFNGGDATATVNAPIDDPTSSGMGFGGFAKRDSAEEKTGEEAGEDDGASNETSGDEVQRFGGSDMPQMPEGMQPPTDGNMPSFSGEQSNSTNDDGNSSSSNNAPMSFNAGSGSSDSRPMVDWIFSDEQYTQAYHELYQQFLNEVDIQGIIDETEALIAPYVERDPTKFCTYEEFQTGVDTLRTFCNLRSQSVQGQLDGTIPSTEEGQQEDSSALIDASNITLSDMGSMGNGGGGGPQPGNGPQQDGSQQSDSNETQQDANNTWPGGNFQPPTGNSTMPNGGFQPPNDGPRSPDGMTFDGGTAQTTADAGFGWIAVGVSIVLLAAGMGVAMLFRRP